MSASSPPTKRLRQSSIVEALKKQASQTEIIKETTNRNGNITKEVNMPKKQEICNMEASSKCASPNKLPKPMDSEIAGCSKNNDEEPQSQDSVMSTDLNECHSPLLFSDSDFEDIPDTPPSSKKSSEVVCRGTPISELHTYPKFLPTVSGLTASKHHTVLIRTPYKSGDEPVVFPITSRDTWDADHVKLPSSPENLYPVDGKGGGKSLNSRWELIQTALLSNMSSSLDLEEAILSYNTRYSQRWNFQGLHSFFTEVLERAEVNAFFKITLPKMVELALQLPQLCTQPIPMLRKQMNHSITLSQKQVASLLANAFFSTFPRRNTAKKQSEYSLYPDINFSSLFQGSKHPKAHRKAEKLKCLINYFRRITNNMPHGTVTFKRQCIKDLPAWNQSPHTLTRLHVTCTGTIEDQGQGMLEVDFANKYLGGGVLGYGCVQEEIRFLICPELILSRLFTEELDRNECLIMTGCERFSNYSGYADSFQWAGNYNDTTPRDSWGRRCTEIVAIDALIFRTYVDQFHENMVRRELNKAYTGFLSQGTDRDHLSAVATGNWGCGAFGGDLRLKGLLQLMAAAAAQRDVCYFTFDNYEIMEDMYKLHEFVVNKKLAVSDLFNLIHQYYSKICRTASRKHRPKINLYDYIYSLYTDFDADTDSTEQDGGPDLIDFDDSSQEGKAAWKQSPDYAADTP